ncbi:MAG: CDP-alcohol phosphatidyltransferase family protein [Chloroflexi bacterium]|nr:CDP-alcohol phosphatidyltransferase family protein [Chloroflexota bacterium]MBI3762744.1 CDP-alcohol phosphatidyltransferase family protein [Chloroflexota bacterium]
MHIPETTTVKRRSLTDWMRVRFRGLLDWAGGALVRLGLASNTMTLLGVAGNIIGAYFLAQGQLTVGGLIVLAAGPIDALDGTMARLRGESSKFGAFVDSTSDRYSELIIFFGLLIHFARQANTTGILLVFAAAAGSVLVSYVKARAEALGYQADVGVLTRLERYLVLSPALIFNVPLIGLWIVAMLANFTALQRIWRVRRQARAERRSDK